MNKPVHVPDDSKMPLAATLAIGGLAVLGALTLIGWLLGAIMGIVKFAIVVVVIISVISWAAGRRLNRR